MATIKFFVTPYIQLADSLFFFLMRVKNLVCYLSQASHIHVFFSFSGLDSARSIRCLSCGIPPWPLLWLWWSVLWSAQFQVMTIPHLKGTFCLRWKIPPLPLEQHIVNKINALEKCSSDGKTSPTWVKQWWWKMNTSKSHKVMCCIVNRFQPRFLFVRRRKRNAFILSCDHDCTETVSANPVRKKAVAQIVRFYLRGRNVSLSVSLSTSCVMAPTVWGAE